MKIISCRVKYSNCHLGEKENHQKPNLENVSVISFVFPINRKTIKVNAMEKEGPSLRWNHTRWKGQEFINELSNYLVSVLEKVGYCAVAPELGNFFKIFMYHLTVFLPTGRRDTRHTRQVWEHSVSMKVS